MSAAVDVGRHVIVSKRKMKCEVLKGSFDSVSKIGDEVIIYASQFNSLLQLRRSARLQ